MRHLPIILKFFTVLGLFGLCTVGAAFYATAQMRVIGARYSQLVEGEDAATLLVSRANRNLQAAANAVANLEISGTDDENTAAMKALNEAGAKFFSYMKQAAAAAPDAAPAIGGLMARVHDVIDNACGNAVALGIAAEDPPDSAVAQQDYIKNCLPAFTAAIAAVTAQTQAMATLSTQRDALLRAATTRTILVTLIGMIGGILVVTGFSFVAINGWVIAPIKTLQAAMGRLAAGDLQTRVAGAGRRD
jgi:methyl-accepting chemotaxis protein